VEELYVHVCLHPTTLSVLIFSIYISHIFLKVLFPKQTCNSEVPVCIGIDLGTTYSCVGVWQHGRVEILANGMGQRTTPSYVAFNETEMLVGDVAMYQAAMNSSNTVFDVKRLIGRKFTDSTVQADMKHWPFHVVEGPNTTPLIEVKYKGETKQIKAEEISAIILTKMKSIAEDYLGKSVQNAVITVPAYFNDSQRRSTINAGTIAGLNVLRIISEPTAAAIAHGLHEQLSKKNILVFDLGGGTFDVSVMKINKGVFEVKATIGDTHLGGEDFDNRMVDYFVKLFEQKFKKDITDNPRSLRRLRTACERAKRALSLSSEVPMEIESLYDGIDFYETITRDCFENLCGDYFQKCMDICNSAVRDSEMSKDEIDEIVVVGGSTRIPKIRSMLSQQFNGKPLYKSINPDEAVAIGATVQAAMMSKMDKSNELPRFILYDVIPLSLGIRTKGGVMSKVIQRNTTIPIKTTAEFFVLADNQVNVAFKIFEGERTMTENNNLLGEIVLLGIPPLPCGKAVMYVTFIVDANGILHVSAIEKTTGKEKSISISYDAGRLTKNDIERMVADAEQYKDEDKAKKDLADAKQRFYMYCYKLKSTIKSDKVKGWITVKQVSEIDEAIVRAVKFLKANAKANIHEFESQENFLRTFSRKIYHVHYMTSIK
jgi:heat shock 70kDa protein 1/2/6/8